MINRIGRIREEVFKDEEKGGRMEDKLDIQDLQDQLKISTGYLVGITFLKDGLLKHTFMTNNFPTGDIEVSFIELLQLAYPDSTISIKKKKKVKESADENKK